MIGGMFERGIRLAALNEERRLGEGIRRTHVIIVHMGKGHEVDIRRRNVEAGELVDERGLVARRALCTPHASEGQTGVPYHQVIVVTNEIAGDEELAHSGLFVAQTEGAHVGDGEMSAVEYRERELGARLTRCSEP